MPRGIGMLKAKSMKIAEQRETNTECPDKINRGGLSAVACATGIPDQDAF